MNIYTFKQEVHKLWRQIPGSKTELLKKQCFILIVSFLLSALLFIPALTKRKARKALSPFPLGSTARLKRTRFFQNTIKKWKVSF